jgi:tagatose-1,6-bisphosphate aldolase
MRALSIGKLRGLQQTSTQNGGFAICALDHRNNLRQLLHPENPSAATIEEMIQFKVDLVDALAPAASAVLLDPEWSAAQCVARGVIPATAGLIVAVEATGYGGESEVRESRVLPGWSIAKSKRMGANAVKLLVYYHPDAPTAKLIEDLVRQVAAECDQHDLPLFLEPLSYSLDPRKKKLDPAERRQVVVETARCLTPLGGDVLKAEFPLDISAEPDEREWDRACTELSQASAIPWVLLSASVEFETYLTQITAACNGGASGIAVGRAVWKEAAEMAGGDRLDFLRGIARQRMERARDLVITLACPWTDFYKAEPVSESWYSDYQEASEQITES